jgi:anti-anti-sigma regulatory factor
MGSAALQCLISMQKTLAAQGHKLLLKELPEDTQETITLLGLNRLTDQKE